MKPASKKINRLADRQPEDGTEDEMADDDEYEQPSDSEDEDDQDAEGLESDDELAVAEAVEKSAPSPRARPLKKKLRKNLAVRKLNLLCCAHSI